MRSRVLSSRINYLNKACSFGVLALVLAGCSSGFQRFDNSFYESAVPQNTAANQPADYNAYPGANGSLDTITTASVANGGKKLSPLATVAPPIYNNQLSHTPEPTYVTPQASYQPPQQYRAPAQLATTPSRQSLTNYRPQVQQPSTPSWQSKAIQPAKLPSVNYVAPVQNSASTTTYIPPKPEVDRGVTYLAAQSTDRITTSSVQKATDSITNNIDRIHTGSVPQKLPSVATVPSASGQDGWSAAGGTAIVARQGETLYNLSKRYGVPVEAIQKANNINASNGLIAGQKVLIPNYVFSPTSAVSAPDNDPKTRASRASTGYLGEATVSHNVVPTKRPPYKAYTAKIDTSASQQQVVSKPVAVSTVQKAVKSDRVVTNSVRVTPNKTVAEVDTTTKPPSKSGISQFRWPVNGKVIEGFGNKSSAGTNEGIDISVPEGTAIKAAENGVVIYAGSEISSYGKLVLIRHEDDWVSAYAHAKDFNVKKGDKVSRGQTIARSGKTGEADRPKLHFELRKGAKPVDPRRYLAG